ncbi:putative reverse transcriptase domain-containing protein [Tanacetum coccineum]
MKVSYDLFIFREEHQCCLLRREAWSSFEVRVGITEEGEVKGRVKLRRVRAMSMTIQSSVKDKILATSSETSKVENAPAEMLRDLDQQMEKRADDGKANVVTDALSRKERVKPRRVRAMAMTIQYGVRGMILTAQSKAFKQDNVPLVGSEMDEAHASRYLVHPGADKTYYNLGDMYWWSCIRKVIAIYVSKFQTCLRGEGCNVKDFWLAATA